MPDSAPATAPPDNSPATATLPRRRRIVLGWLAAVGLMLPLVMLLTMMAAGWRSIQSMTDIAAAAGIAAVLTAGAALPALPVMLWARWRGYREPVAYILAGMFGVVCIAGVLLLLASRAPESGKHWRETPAPGWATTLVLTMLVPALPLGGLAGWIAWRVGVRPRTRR